MHTSAREEARLPEQTNELETLKPPPDISEPASTPEPEAGQPETQEQEETALVPTEPEVIEGEVVELEPLDSPEASPPPKQKPYWVLIPFAIVLCLLFLAGSFLVPLLTPLATITIIPAEKTVSMTTAIQVHGRLLPPLTLAQSATVPATGKRHQDATEAHGTITFYNGLLSRQTIAFGTILTGADGIQIITDQPATIPAANPPLEGQITVSAHAISTGARGNIPAYDINTACCATAVLAKNTQPFTGGAAARDVLIVTKHDLEAAAGALTTTLLKSEQAALHAQLTAGEALITPPCKRTTTADHRIGEEAKEATMTVSETCTGITYDAHTLHLLATQMITHQPLRTGYTLFGDVTDTVIHATITDQARGITTLSVQADATYVYQLSPGEKQQLVKLIAGKPKQQAQALLSQVPGIAGVAITINGNAATLPDDPDKITIVIAERA